MPPALMLEVLTQWIEDGTVQEIIEWHRREITSRWEIARLVLGSTQLSCHSETYHVWMRLPRGWNSSDFVDEAYEQGVALSPSDTFMVNTNQEAPDAVRIGLGFPNSRETLREGLQRIASLLKQAPITTKVTAK